MKEEPYPQVIIADNGFAHREMKPRLMQIALNASIVHYWKNIHRESPIPKYMFYQHAKVFTKIVMAIISNIIFKMML